MKGLAGLYFVQGWHEAALGFYKNSLDIRKRIFGSNHVLTSEARYEVGRVLSARGKYDRAEPYLERALEIQDKLMRGRSPPRGKDSGRTRQRVLLSGQVS